MIFYLEEYIFVWNIYLNLFVTLNSLKILIVELKIGNLFKKWRPTWGPVITTP